jgi:predicted nucleotidyltransferase
MVRSATEVDQISRHALETIEQEIPITAAFLFGSYAEGRAHAESDIDLAVFTTEHSRLKIADRSRLQLQLQRQCALDLELHLYSADALERARPTNFYGYLLEHGKRLR